MLDRIKGALRDNKLFAKFIEKNLGVIFKFNFIEKYKYINDSIKYSKK